MVMAPEHMASGMMVSGMAAMLKSGDEEVATGPAKHAISMPPSHQA